MTDYDVVLLVEQPLSELDASQVRSLHEEIDEQVLYHLLVPVAEVAQHLEAGMGALGTADVLAVPPVLTDPESLREAQSGVLDEARTAVKASIDAIIATGGRAVGDVVSIDPIRALADKVAAVDAREAIILTRPHVVAEFFHLDWTSRARRKLGVPVLHLLEHETFDEQAGEGEGISGF
jgi:hypothetical protein